MAEINELQQEIVERKRVETALIEERDLANALLDLADAIILVLDRQGRILRFSRGAEAMTGYGFAEVRQRSFDLFLLPEEKARVQEIFESLKQGEFPKSNENHWLTKTGEKRLLAWKNTVLFEASGAVKCVVSVGTDITEQRRLETERRDIIERLKSSNQNLQNFASFAAHDLQAPLRRIGAFSKLLQKELGDSLQGDSQLYLGRMQNAVERMSQLIADLLLFARVTEQRAAWQTVNLTSIAHEVVADLEIPIQESRAQVKIGQLPQIEAEPTQMRQLLQNLITNALKFAKPDQVPLVVVEGELIENGRQLRFSVRDNGIGFEQKQAQRIFGIFQRLHGQQHYTGSGIGLAICQRIVEGHRGKISAHSAPLQGAELIVTLPVSQHETDTGA